MYRVPAILICYLLQNWSSAAHRCGQMGRKESDYQLTTIRKCSMWQRTQSRNNSHSSIGNNNTDHPFCLSTGSQSNESLPSLVPSQAPCFISLLVRHTCWALNYPTPLRLQCLDKVPFPRKVARANNCRCTCNALISNGIGRCNWPMASRCHQRHRTHILHSGDFQVNLLDFAGIYRERKARSFKWELILILSD